MLKMWLRARGSSANLLADRSGIAATEFAVIVPVMLLMFFGLVEFSSGVAADRKVTLVARTLSDLSIDDGVRYRPQQLWPSSQSRYDTLFGDAVEIDDFGIVRRADNA